MVTVSKRDIAIAFSVFFFFGVFLGYGTNTLLQNPTEKVFNATVVKIKGRYFLNGNNQQLLPIQWNKLVEGDTHCVRISYDVDGFVSRIDVSEPGAKCND